MTAMFMDCRIVLTWDAEGSPIWSDWESVERKLYAPLLRNLSRLHVYGLEWSRDSIEARVVRSFLEKEAVPHPDGGLEIKAPERLLGHKAAPFFWSSARGSYRLSQLMLFERRCLHDD